RGAAARGAGRRQLTLHTPGRRRGNLAGHAAPARQSAAGGSLHAGELGPRRGEHAGRRPRSLVRALDRLVTDTASEQAEPESAAAPSPFTPSADYAFLSNCHTGALIAPDGAIDWLCVPSFDSPSVFASLLDREAGFFRLGPYGINHPSDRTYEPGTNVLVTT